MRRIVRVVLVLLTALSLLGRLLDVADYLCCGVFPSGHRLVTLEVDSAIVLVLTTWYLGWYLWKEGSSR